MLIVSKVILKIFFRYCKVSTLDTHHSNNGYFVSYLITLGTFL